MLGTDNPVIQCHIIEEQNPLFYELCLECLVILVFFKFFSIIVIFLIAGSMLG